MSITPAPVLPSDVLDLSDWKITLPTGKENSPTEVTGAALKALSIPVTFWVADDGAVHFRAAVNGVTTSNSGNPRSELREMQPGGSKVAKWSAKSGYHRLSWEEAFTHLPNPRTDGGHAGVVGAQIHDASNDITVFRCETTGLYVTKGNDTHYALIDGHYTLGTRYRGRFEVDGSTIRAYYNDALVATIPCKSTSLYFKAGCYTQANATNSTPANATNYGETVLYSVAVEHSDKALPPVTAPPVDPPPATLGLGVGGTPAATGPNAVLATADSTATLNITAGGKTYDGQGHTVPKINVAADGVTVQNYRVTGAANSGIVSEGVGNVIRNNDISHVAEAGTGDINAVTFFGDGTQILYNNIDQLVQGAPGDSHTDGIQTWNTPAHRASSNVTIRGNRINGPVVTDPAYIHQGVMAEGKDSTDGGGGGVGVSANWLVDGNFFNTYGNQALKFDDVDNVVITRNVFAGAATKIVEPGMLSVGTTYYADNVVTGTYGSVGVPVTAGVGPTALPTAQDPPPVVTPPASKNITIMIGRHGEKPDKSHPGFTDITYTKQDSHSLTANGWVRAKDLPGVVFGLPNGSPRAGLVRPDVVYAADGPNAGLRMLQTVTYLCPALGVAPVARFDKGAEKALAAELKTLLGKTAYISWEHSEIPPLAAALGTVTPKPPKTWPDDRYDVIWVFRSADGGKTWAFSQVLEAIGLPGEQKTPIK